MWNLVCWQLTQVGHSSLWLSWPGGGAVNFFSGRGVRPGFPKWGACELTFASEKGGLVSGKFPNLGACELKIYKFGALWAKIWVKIEADEAKISNFLKRGSCELTLLLEMGPLRAAGEAWKGGLQGCTSPYPLSRSVPPPRVSWVYKNTCGCLFSSDIQWSCGDLSDGNMYAFGLVASSFVPRLPGAPYGFV